MKSKSLTKHSDCYKMANCTFFAFYLFLFCWNFGKAQCPPPGFPPFGDVCYQAPVLCTNLDGYCNTLGTNNVQVPFPGCGGNVLNNDEWIGFIAGSSTITIEIIPSNCEGINGQFGMQAAIFQGSCSGPAIAIQCTCATLAFQLSASNFNVGQVYYMVLDGCAGDICDYEVNVIQGSTLPAPPAPPGPISGPTNVCPGGTSTFSIPNPNQSTFDWTLAPSGLGSFVGSNQGGAVQINWTAAGTGQICVTSSNPCESNPTPSCHSVIAVGIPQTVVNIDICEGECTECAGQMFCAPTPPSGTSVTLDSWLGCDSLIICQVNQNPLPVSNLGQLTFCHPYIYNVCGTPYSSSQLINHTCPNGSWLGCDSIVIADLAILNPQPIISNQPVLTCGAGAIATLLGGSSILSNAPGVSSEFLWSGPGIVGPVNLDSIVINIPGNYCLTITESRNGVTCSNQTCMTITQNTSPPQSPQLSGDETPCLGTTVIYSVSSSEVPPPQSYNWSIPNGTPFTILSPTVIQITWNNPLQGDLCVAANNSCGTSIPTCFSIIVSPPPIQPEIDGPNAICATSDLHGFKASSNESGVVYNWTVPSGATFDSFDDSIAVNFSGAQPGVGEVCVTSENACATSTPSCISVNIFPSPVSITWIGYFHIWSLPENWDLGYIPTPCNDVFIPSGLALLPIGPPGLGRTLEVNVGASLDVPLGTELIIGW